MGTYFTAALTAYLTFQTAWSALIFDKRVDEDCAWLAQRVGVDPSDRLIAISVELILVLLRAAGALAGWLSLLAMLSVQ